MMCNISTTSISQLKVTHLECNTTSTKSQRITRKLLKLIVAFQCFIRPQVGVKYFTVLFEIPQMPLFPYADIYPYFFKQLQVRDVIVSLQLLVGYNFKTKKMKPL